MPPNGKTKGRFELLTVSPINYSLTEGTSIPPPPESPVEETAPPIAPPKETEKASHPLAVDTGANGTSRGRSSVAANTPTSPTSVRRPSSIRNFLARKAIQPNPTNGMIYDGSAEDLMERPDSVASFRTGGPGSSGLVKKKSWFRRLSSVPRSSTVYENEAEQKRPAGPPPPMLPELNQLKAKIPEGDEGGLGGEALFKNIT